MVGPARIYWLVFLVVWLALLFLPIAFVTPHRGSSYAIHVWMGYGMIWDWIVNPPLRGPIMNPWAAALGLFFIHNLGAMFPALVCATIAQIWTRRQ